MAASPSTSSRRCAASDCAGRGTWWQLQQLQPVTASHAPSPLTPLQGDGEKPKAGNKVTCHYVGKFPDGRDFDSSRKRGKPFEVRLRPCQCPSPAGSGCGGGGSGGCGHVSLPSSLAASSSLASFPQFVVGVGQVIKGWDVGMLTMAVGEKAILKCTSDYAYGDEGERARQQGP